MKHILEIAVFLFLLILALAAAVRSADAASEIPVYGPAAVGFEDDDLRRETIIPAGVLVVTPEEPNRLWIGDGVTKGGLEVRAKPCVTGFVDVAVATTNLTMGLWPVTFGDWAVRGGENAFGVMRGGNYKFYITYTGETTYAKYLFGMDGDVYTFTCNSVQGAQSPPWLLMTTNLLEDFQRVETGLEYVDSVTARLVWTNDTSADTLFFRVVTDRFEEEALVATVPIHADAGIVATGSITIDGTNVATVADAEGLASVAVAPVAAGIAAVQGAVATNAGNITTNSSRIAAIESDYVHSSALADLATIAALDAAEERVGAVEGMLEEYWCKWSTESLSPLPATNYIPTNWPASKVYCIFANDQTVEFRISLPDNWYPDESCELHLVLWKMLTNSPSISVYAEGGAVTSLTGTSITGREGIFRYRPGYGWIFTSHAYTGAPYNIRDGVRRQIQNATWPNDEKFTPVIQGAVQLLSAPSLQSLRPSLSSSAPLALDADIDDSDLAIDAAPDALDSDESDDLEDAPEEDTP